MAAEIVVVDLDLDVDGDYERFIRELRKRLADHPQRLDYIAKYDWLVNNPLLRKQEHPKQPARWIHVNLRFQDLNTNETIGTTIAVRDDNVYLIGFRNGNGQWYEFGFENGSSRFIEGSTFLGCDLSYHALVGDSAELVHLNLGKYAAMYAVRRLWEYEQVVPADPATREKTRKKTIKELARMCVMICESARMMPHYHTVNDGWDNAENRISAEHAGYITNWKSMSRKLLSMRDPSPEREHLLGVVHLVLNSPAKKGTQGRQQQQEQSPPPEGGGPSKRRRGSNPQLPQTSSWRPASSSGGGTQQQGRTPGKSVRGRPLLEVYSMWGHSGVVVDTIVVFDGKRGQIIYKHDDHDESLSQRTSTAPFLGDGLALTGPYRAISAEGSFVIQVDGTIPGTDSRGNSSKVSGELFWDCYAEDVVYDKFLWADVISTDTGRRLAEVTYEVWRDAVEATVEVNLLLPGITRVSGLITAHCLPNTFYPTTIMLFSRTVEVPSSADSMVPLELSRSVIAVPVHTSDSGLKIWVGLHTATPNDEDGVLLEGVIDFDFDKHTGEIVVRSFPDFFVPVGGTGGFDPTGGISASHGSPGAPTSASHEGTEQTSVQQCKVQVNVTSPGFHISSHNSRGR